MLKILIFASSLLIDNFVSSKFIYKGFDDSLELEWWQTEIIYQVYIRSFKDSDGDGVGDINGITEKVDYFNSINVGAVWISPIFTSPQEDNGYDVSDYKGIDPLYGTSDDFDRLRDALYKNGIKLILDFVPNHTSNEHPWFKQSVQGKEPYKNYYIWKDPKFDNDNNKVPPNNWLARFNDGSAWEWNEIRQQYYFHAFHKGQPDLNFRNPDVAEEMKSIMTYWLRRGVDGFRLDAVNFIYEREDLADEPRSYLPDVHENDYEYLNHTNTINLPETYVIIKKWRKLLDDYSKLEGTPKFLTSECYASVNLTMQYYGNETSPGVHFPLNFNFISNFDEQSDAYVINDIIKSWMLNMPENRWASWTLSNHDRPRVASRVHSLLAEGFHMLQMLLPGTPITYYADELGVPDTFVRWNETVDRWGIINGLSRYKMFSRDPARTPFLWDGSTNAGFTNGTNGTWLPVSPEYWRDNVVEQSKHKSPLRTYRQLGRLRRSPTILYGDLHVYVLSKWVFGFSRSYSDHPTYFIVVNFGSVPEIVNIKAVRRSLPEIIKVKISSINSGYVTGNLLRTNNITLRPKASLVLSTSRQNEESF